MKKRNKDLIMLLPAMAQFVLTCIPFEIGVFMRIVSALATTVLLAVLGVLFDNDNNEKTLFNYFSDNFVRVVFINICFAFIPPVVALVESDFCRKTYIAERSYIIGNTIYNLLGAVVVSVIFVLASKTDYPKDYLGKNSVKIIVNLSLPISFLIAFTYQGIESAKNVSDHSPSLIDTVNQNVNALFLIWIYNLFIASIVSMIGYGLYCKINHIEKLLTTKHIWILSVVVLFLYLCAFNLQQHIKMLYVIGVPIVIVFSLILASYHKHTEAVEKQLLVFVVFHLLAYILSVLLMFNVIDITNARTYLFWVVIGATLISVVLIIWNISFGENIYKDAAESGEENNK